MTLTDYLRVLRKRWKIVVAVLVVGVLVGILYVSRQTKMYEASAQIFVSISGSSDTTAIDLAQGQTFTEARVQSYTSVADTPAVTGPVVSQLGLHMTADQLSKEISADAPLNKVLINLHVTDRDPAQAQRLANAVANQFSQVVTTLEQGAGESSAVKLTVIRPARLPSAPVSPRTKLDIAIGGLVGLILGVALGFMRELLDNTVKDPAELTSTSTLPVLGIVPWDKRAGSSPISFRADAHGTRAEGFRQMRTNLQFVDVDNPPRVIAITSALPGEGKTHTAMNLATALAESGVRVCLLEADLRKPSIASTLGVIGDVGLTTALIGAVDVTEVMQAIGENLSLVASGPIPPNPSELIESRQFRTVLAKLRQLADVVVIDTAPLLPVADGSQVAALADATLLTVRANKTSRDQISRAVEALGNVGVTPVGAVLSMAPHHRHGGYDYYYGDYRPALRRARHSERKSGEAAQSTLGVADLDGDTELVVGAPDRY